MICNVTSPLLLISNNSSSNYMRMNWSAPGGIRNPCHLYDGPGLTTGPTDLNVPLNKISYFQRSKRRNKASLWLLWCPSHNPSSVKTFSPFFTLPSNFYFSLNSFSHFYPLFYFPPCSFTIPPFLFTISPFSSTISAFVFTISFYPTSLPIYPTYLTPTLSFLPSLPLWLYFIFTFPFSLLWVWFYLKIQCKQKSAEEGEKRIREAKRKGGNYYYRKIIKPAKPFYHPRGETAP